MPSRWNPDTIPCVLKEMSQWVCWDLKPDGDGRTTKVPVCARGGMASSTDSSTWASFEEAVAACSNGGHSGIGFVFAPDRAVTGLDLDHVLNDDGSLVGEYQWVVDEADTYTEISPSGDGLHLFFLNGKPEEATKCKKGQTGGCAVEMYDHARFFTVTGDVYIDANGVRHDVIKSNPSVVSRVYETFLQDDVKKIEPESRPQATPVELDDEALLGKMFASRKGAELQRLWNGDTSSYGGDDSAADLALCNHLAFWTCRDEMRMDALFRRSGLMREKWDEQRGNSTYGQQTIERAIADTRETYSPSRSQAVCGNQNQTSDTAEDLDSESEAFGCWIKKANGELWKIDKRQTEKADEVRHMVTSTVPCVVADLADIDTGGIRALVSMRIGGCMVERAIDRNILFSTRSIVDALAPMGANITSTNARDVVAYLTDCENRDGGTRGRFDSVTRLGWAREPLGPFMPYDAGNDSVRFDPADDFASQARPFLDSCGSLDGWRDGICGARQESFAFRAVLAASFASPLAAVLGVQPCIVYIWGRSRSGKTPTLKAAGSVWGNPSEGADSYFRTFNDTPKSIVRAASFLHDIPLIIDELQCNGAGGNQAQKRSSVENLLYELSLGRERGALNSNRSMMHSGSWRCLTIATGEIPIIGTNTQQGAANRTLELNAEPFEDQHLAQKMHRIVSEQYGTAGRAFIGELRQCGLEELRRRWNSFRTDVERMAGGHPQAGNIALVCFADALAQEFIFLPDACWEDAADDAKNLAQWLFEHTAGRIESDTDVKAIRFVAEWLQRNMSRLCPAAEGERYGKYTAADGDVKEWQVFSSMFQADLEREGYDCKKTLRRMKEEGLLVCGKTGFTKQVRFDTGRVYCVCIKNDELMAFLDNPEPRLMQSELDLSA